MFGRSRPQVVALSRERQSSGLWTLALFAIIGLTLYLMLRAGDVELTAMLSDMGRTVKGLLF